MTARTFEVTAAVAERQRVEQVNRDLNQRIVVLEQSNSSHEANSEDVRGKLQGATAVPIGVVRRNVEVQGTAVVDALDNVPETVEGFVATIERIREMNLGEGLASHFGDPTLDPDR